MGTVTYDCYGNVYKPDHLGDRYHVHTTDQFEEICKPADGKDGKYLLDLPLANYHIFADCGVKPGKIVLPDLCTSCNSDILHSHRASGGKRGGMCAFLMIRESARLPHPFQSSR